jgi:hypothetical protein
MAFEFNTPVAFFVFNRPETTRAVFAAIAAARPSVLLIVADGARQGRVGESERVHQVRAIVSAVDWPCDVRNNFSEVNLGCKHRVSSGLDWVFSQVDKAIILEDDCLPSLAFFQFSQEMLQRYSDNKQIFSISGSNFTKNATPDGHYFSNYPLMWGWATWRDRWAAYNVEPEMPYALLRNKWWSRPIAYLYWRRIFSDLTRGRIDTWDYQWLLTVWRNNGLAVRPSVNLVRNIGFAANATHTKNVASPLAKLTAWDGDAALLASHEEVRADAIRDAIDERIWGLINWKSALLMYFPLLSR